MGHDQSSRGLCAQRGAGCGFREGIKQAIQETIRDRVRCDLTVFLLGNQTVRPFQSVSIPETAKPKLPCTSERSGKLTGGRRAILGKPFDGMGCDDSLHSLQGG